MLQVRVRSLEISAIQRSFRERGTIAETRTASRISQMRIGFEVGAKRFGERQREAQRKGGLFLRDGRVATLRHHLFGPLATHAWPRGWPLPAAGVLHGLRLSSHRLLADIAPPPAHWRVDPESYWAVLYDGPEQERRFGDMAALALYLDPLNTLEIVWLGPEDHLELGWQALLGATANQSDWSRFSPDYHAWLVTGGVD